MNDEKKIILGPEDYAEPRCLLCGEPYGAAPEVKPDSPLARTISAPPTDMIESPPLPPLPLVGWPPTPTVTV